MKKPGEISRRKFIGSSIVTTAGVAAGFHSLFGMPGIIRNYNNERSRINGIQLGVITYSFRSLPDQSAEATLQYIVDCGVSAVELMGGPAEEFAGIPKNSVARAEYRALQRKRREDAKLSEKDKKQLEEMRIQMESYNKEIVEWRSKVSMDKFVELRKMYEAAGVSIYGFKPSAFAKRNTDAEINYGFRAAKALGASHVTLEHPSDDQHTKKLGDMASKHGIYVAYHGHTQQTPTFWDTALSQSKYNALNLDAGHYVAAGNPSVIDLINAKYDRIMSIHMKDRQKPANGKANLPWGEGDTPIKEILHTMRDKKYEFPVTVELEYKIPNGSDAVKEVRKCVEYCKSVLGV